MFKKLSIFLFFVSSSLFSHGVSDSDKADMVSGGLVDYFVLGAKHMITGYDHILFLIGVIFFLKKFSDIAKFITSFTLGHSITLIFATFYEITANYYLIDAVIALSVIYKGFENLDGFKKIFKTNAPNLILMVFIFGLIHGFGLSSRLQQLPLGDNNLLGKIISFNLGVEVGQIAILAIIFPLLILLKKGAFTSFSKIVNSGLILAGVFLFFFQLYGFINEKRKNQSEYHGHHHQMHDTNTKEFKKLEKKNHSKENTHHHGDGKHHSH